MSRQQMQKNGRKTMFSSVSNLCTYTLVTCALVVAGCAQPQRETTTGQVYVPDIGKAETMALVEDVLANMHFAIEKSDIQSGVIRTRPLSGAQFFELWRSDNVGPDNSFQANLHTIRRTAELDISQNAGQLCIGCVVRVQRLSLPERQLRSNARGYEMFSRSSSVVQRLELHAEQEKNMAWIELRNDVPLAKEILSRIEARIASQTSDHPQTTGDRT
ncbi:MAG: hypothetical protein AAB403_23835 [Planctomycetota bacterium]